MESFLQRELILCLIAAHHAKPLHDAAVLALRAVHLLILSCPSGLRSGDGLCGLLRCLLLELFCDGV